MSKIIDAGFGRGINAPLGRKYETENIIGKIDSINNRKDNDKINVIFMTHYDTKNQLFMSALRVNIFIVGLLYALLCGIRIFGGSILLILSQNIYNTY